MQGSRDYILKLLCLIHGINFFSVTTLNPYGPTKYHFAAHMGQLIRGQEGSGCSNFFPSCPFTGDDVRQIARKIKLR